MNKKLLAEFRDVNANPRVVIDYREIKDSVKLREISGKNYYTGTANFYIYAFGETLAISEAPDYPHRLVTVDEFYKEEEWQPMPGDVVRVKNRDSGLWCRRVFLFKTNRRYYCHNGNDNCLYGFEEIEPAPKPIPTISIEEAEEKLKSFGVEVKITDLK